MNLNSKKPEKRPLYVYYIIAVVIIVLLNVFALPALSERSVKETDYTTFLKAVDRGKVYEATLNSDYIYYTMKVDGNDVYCKTVSVEDQDLVSHLYDAGVSIEGTAAETVPAFISDPGICTPDRNLYSPGTLAQQEDDEFHGKRRTGRNDVLWQKQCQGLCEILYGNQIFRCCR